MPPTAFWILPSALSALPSDLSLLSPVRLPAPSFTSPFIFFKEPSVRSSLMVVSSNLLIGLPSTWQFNQHGPPGNVTAETEINAFVGNPSRWRRKHSLR